MVKFLYWVLSWLGILSICNEAKEARWSSFSWNDWKIAVETGVGKDAGAGYEIEGTCSVT